MIDSFSAQMRSGWANKNLLCCPDSVPQRVSKLTIVAVEVVTPILSPPVPPQRPFLANVVVAAKGCCNTTSSKSNLIKVLKVMSIN